MSEITLNVKVRNLTRLEGVKVYRQQAVAILSNWISKCVEYQYREGKVARQRHAEATQS